MTSWDNNPKPVIEKLRADHTLDHFDCGSEQLNRFLQRFALMNQKAGSAQTYLALRSKIAVGYYSLAVGSVMHADAPVRVTKGQPKHPLPIMLLARLAVDHAEQGQGIGQGLLKDALRRTAQAADIAGIRALLVHAKDDSARRFYEHFNFDPSPTDPYHLYLLIKDIRQILGN